MSIGGDILRDKILNFFAGFSCLFVLPTETNTFFVFFLPTLLEKNKS